jgi:hypothetical protein
MFVRMISHFVLAVICVCLAQGRVLAQKLYWSDLGTLKIQCADLDGLEPEDIITTGLINPMGLAFDAHTGMVYWTDAGLSGERDGGIYRAQVACGETQELVNGLVDPRGIALDHSSDTMFWTDTGVVSTAHLDGENAWNILPNLFPSPTDLALDSASNHIYFTSHLGLIRSASLTGNELATVLDLTIDSGPVAIALDIAGGKMYWSEAFPFPKLGRANLDGTEQEFLPAPSDFDAGDIAIDPGEGKIYWTFGGAIHRANLDGSDHETLNIPGLEAPFALAIDLGLETLVAHLDIRPGSCPNSVNASSKGVVSIALVGSADFDVSQVDVDSIRLSRSDGVGTNLPQEASRRSKPFFADVTSPTCSGACDCNDSRKADGTNDLILKFSTQTMAQQLELAGGERKAFVMLRITGMLLDGTAFEASDCIVLSGKR